jgi:Mn-dependent DtxR family transcriptional regulator
LHLLDRPVPLADLCETNSWSKARLHQLLRLGLAEGLLTFDPASNSCHLSAQGKLEARRVTRNHRLWEIYLLEHADVAPQHIHHNADQIEHVVEPDIVNELEELLAGRSVEALVPADPEKPSLAPEGIR